MSSLIKFNPLPNSKIFDLSRFKAFTENKVVVTKKIEFPFYRVENIVGKGESPGNHYFLLFSQCFQKAPSLGSLKVGLRSKKLNVRLWK